MDGSYKRGKNNKQLNVLGGELEPCVSSHDKNEIVTGFYRDNCCNTGPDAVSYTHLTLPTIYSV